MDEAALLGLPPAMLAAAAGAGGGGAAAGAGADASLTPVRGGMPGLCAHLLGVSG